MGGFYVLHNPRSCDVDSGGGYVEVRVEICEKYLIFYSVCCELKSSLKIKSMLKVKKKYQGSASQTSVHVFYQR